jgi:hypothetical protein
VIIKNGWRISEKISSKYHLRKEELLEADQNEIEQALTFSRQSRRRAKYKQVRSNIGLLLRLREEGMTYGDIALYLTRIKKINISRSGVHKIISEYKKKGLD